jgi:hypothetical protein
VKAYWGSGIVTPSILDLDTSWRWVVSFTPRLLYPQGKSPPGTHWIGGWVGPRAGLDAVVWRKIPSPCRDSNPPDLPARRRVLYHWAIPTLHRTKINKNNHYLIFPIHNLSCLHFSRIWKYKGTVHWISYVYVLSLLFISYRHQTGQQVYTSHDAMLFCILHNNDLTNSHISRRCYKISCTLLCGTSVADVSTFS